MRLHTGSSDGSRLFMMVYRDGKLFKENNNQYLGNHDVDSISKYSNYGVLNSYIISASIGGKQIKGLSSRVRTIFKPLKVRNLENFQILILRFASNKFQYKYIFIYETKDLTYSKHQFSFKNVREIK